MMNLESLSIPSFSRNLILNFNSIFCFFNSEVQASGFQIRNFMRDTTKLSCIQMQNFPNGNLPHITVSILVYDNVQIIWIFQWIGYLFNLFLNLSYKCLRYGTWYHLLGSVWHLLVKLNVTVSVCGLMFFFEVPHCGSSNISQTFVEQALMRFLFCVQKFVEHTSYFVFKCF